MFLYEVIEYVNREASYLETMNTYIRDEIEEKGSLDFYFKGNRCILKSIKCSKPTAFFKS